MADHTGPALETAPREASGYRGAVKIALGYALIAGLWIFLSDRMVQLIGGAQGTGARLQTFKGLFFVAATAVLLYGLIARLTRRVERANALSRVAMESLPDGVLVLAAPGSVVHANSAALDMLGVSLEELLGPIGKLHGRLERIPDATAQAEEVLLHSLRGEATIGRELPLGRPDGRTLIVSLSALPIRAERRPMAVAIMRDVSELRRLERLRDEFLSTAAHELKTPIASLKGYAQLLLRWNPEGRDPREVQALQVFERQSERIARIVDEILEIGRLQAAPLELSREPVDLGEIAAAAVERVGRIAPRHRLLFESAGQAPVLADRARLGAVLLNLLDNAVRFSPQGSEVRTRVETVGGEVRVTVADQGAGIPAERRAEVFERFVKPHAGTRLEYQSGIGLGLSVSRQIVEGLGGRMWFESEEGRGSTFHFSLPRREETRDE